MNQFVFLFVLITLCDAQTYYYPNLFSLEVGTIPSTGQLVSGYTFYTTTITLDFQGGIFYENSFGANFINTIPGVTGGFGEGATGCYQTTISSCTTRTNSLGYVLTSCTVPIILPIYQLLQVFGGNRSSDCALSDGTMFEIDNNNGQCISLYPIFPAGSITGANYVDSRFCNVQTFVITPSPSVQPTTVPVPTTHAPTYITTIAPTTLPPTTAIPTTLYQFNGMQKLLAGQSIINGGDTCVFSLTQYGVAVLNCSPPPTYIETFFWSSPVVTPQVLANYVLYLTYDGRIAIGIQNTYPFWFSLPFANNELVSTTCWQMIITVDSLIISCNGFDYWDTINGVTSFTYAGTHLAVGQELKPMQYLMFNYPTVYILMLPTGNSCLYRNALPNQSSAFAFICNGILFTTSSHTSQWYSYVSNTGLFCVNSGGDTLNSLSCSWGFNAFVVSTGYELWFDMNTVVVVDTNKLPNAVIATIQQGTFTSITSLQSDSFYTYTQFTDNVQFHSAISDPNPARLVFTNQDNQVCIFPVVLLNNSGSFTWMISPHVSAITCSLSSPYDTQQNSISTNNPSVSLQSYSGCVIIYTNNNAEQFSIYVLDSINVASGSFLQMYMSLAVSSLGYKVIYSPLQTLSFYGSTTTYDLFAYTMPSNFAQFVSITLSYTMFASTTTSNANAQMEMVTTGNGWINIQQGTNCDLTTSPHYVGFCATNFVLTNAQLAGLYPCSPGSVLQLFEYNLAINGVYITTGSYNASIVYSVIGPSPQVVEVPSSNGGANIHQLTPTSSFVRQSDPKYNVRFTDPLCQSVLLFYGDGSFCLSSTGVKSCSVAYDIYTLPPSNVFWCSAPITRYTNADLSLYLVQQANGLLTVYDSVTNIVYWNSFDVNLFEPNSIPFEAIISTNFDPDVKGISTYVNGQLLWSSKTNTLTSTFSISTQLVDIHRCSLNALANHNTPLAFTSYCGFALPSLSGSPVYPEETSPATPTNGLQISYSRPKLPTNSATTIGVLLCAGIDNRTVNNFNPAIGTELLMLCERVQFYYLNGSSTKEPDFAPCYSSSSQITNYFWVTVQIGPFQGLTTTSYWNPSYQDKKYDALYPEFSQADCECRKSPIGQLQTFFSGSACTTPCTVTPPFAASSMVQHVWCDYNALPQSSIFGYIMPNYAISSPLTMPIVLVQDRCFSEIQPISNPSNPYYQNSFYYYNVPQSTCLFINPNDRTTVNIQFTNSGSPTAIHVCEWAESQLIALATLPFTSTTGANGVLMRCVTSYQPTSGVNSYYYDVIEMLVTSFNTGTLTGSATLTQQTSYSSTFQCITGYYSVSGSYIYCVTQVPSINELIISSAVNTISSSNLISCVDQACSTVFFNKDTALYSCLNGFDLVTSSDTINGYRLTGAATPPFFVCTPNKCSSEHYGFFCGAVCQNCADMFPRTICNEGRSGTGECECIPGLIFDQDSVGCVDPTIYCPNALNSYFGPNALFDSCVFAPGVSFIENVAVKVVDVSTSLTTLPYVTQTFNCSIPWPIQNIATPSRLMLCNGVHVNAAVGIQSSVSTQNAQIFNTFTRPAGSDVYYPFCNGNGQARIRFTYNNQAFISSSFANMPQSSSTQSNVDPLLINMFNSEGNYIESDNSMVFYSQQEQLNLNSLNNLICECTNGNFWGNTCQNKCGSYYPGLSYCDRTTGTVTCDTSSGAFLNTTTQKCQRSSCPVGQGGPSCLLTCPACGPGQFCQDGIYGAGVCSCINPNQFIQQSTGNCTSLDILCGVANSEGVRCSGNGVCSLSTSSPTVCVCDSAHQGIICQYSNSDVLFPYETVFDCGITWIPITGVPTNIAVYPYVIQDRQWRQQISFTQPQATFQDVWGDTYPLPSFTASSITTPSSITNNFQTHQTIFICQSVIDCIGYIQISSTQIMYLTADASLATPGVSLSSYSSGYNILSRTNGYNCEEYDYYTNFRLLYNPSTTQSTTSQSQLNAYLLQIPLFQAEIASMSFSEQVTASITHWITNGFLVRVNPTSNCFLSPTYFSASSNCVSVNGLCGNLCGTSSINTLSPVYAGYCINPLIYPNELNSYGTAAINGMSQPYCSCNCESGTDETLLVTTTCSAANNMFRYVGLYCENDMFFQCGISETEQICNGHGTCNPNNENYPGNGVLLTQVGACTCDPGYFGTTCTKIATGCGNQTIDGFVTFCSGFGTCNNDVSCVCDAGRGGQYCELDLSYCLLQSVSNPTYILCSNQGQCLKNSTGGYSCSCNSPTLTSQPYVGQYCQVAPCPAVLGHGYCYLASPTSSLALTMCYPAYTGSSCANTYCSQELYTKNYCDCAIGDPNAQLQYNVTVSTADGPLTICTSVCPVACGSTKQIVFGSCSTNLATTQCIANGPTSNGGIVSYPGTSTCSCGSGYYNLANGACTTFCANGYVSSVTPCTSLSSLSSSSCSASVAPTTPIPTTIYSTGTVITTIQPTTFHSTSTATVQATTSQPTTIHSTGTVITTVEPSTTSQPTTVHSPTIFNNSTNSTVSSSSLLTPTQTIIVASVSAVVGSATITTLIYLAVKNMFFKAASAIPIPKAGGLYRQLNIKISKF